MKPLPPLPPECERSLALYDAAVRVAMRALATSFDTMTMSEIAFVQRPVASQAATFVRAVRMAHERRTLPPVAREIVIRFTDDDRLAAELWRARFQPSDGGAS